MSGRARAVLLASILIAGVPQSSSALGPVDVELGFQLDSFHETFAVGDLLADLDGLPTVTDDPTQDERLESDETLPGGFLSLRWQPPGAYARKAELGYEQDSKDARGTLALLYAVPLGGAWRLSADEDLRIQRAVSSSSDRGSDLSHELEVLARRSAPRGTNLAFSLKEELSRATGDTLFDHDLLGGAAEASRRLGPHTVKAKVEWSHRNSFGGFFSDRDRWTGRLSSDAFSTNGFSYDVDASGTRADYGSNGEVSPSGYEGEVDLHLAHPLQRLSWDDGYRAELDGRFLVVDYDDPDSTYVSYALTETELTLAGPWQVPSVAVAAGGEWLRPRSAGGGAYDESRATLKVGLLPGLTDLWMDVETSIGYRDYLGAGRELGTGGATGSLDLDTSDFWYTDLTLVGSGAWRSLHLDTSAQWTMERHTDESDDATYFLLNVRLGVHF